MLNITAKQGLQLHGPKYQFVRDIFRNVQGDPSKTFRKTLQGGKANFKRRLYHYMHIGKRQFNHLLDKYISFKIKLN